MMTAAIALSNIEKSYTHGQGTQRVLDGVDLTIHAGEAVSIMGPSGSGKSSIMNIMGLLDQPDSGAYHFEGQLVSGLDDDALASIRNRKIGFVFQSYFLLNRLKVWENVALPLVYQGLEEAQRKERALEILEQVAMSNWAHHYPNELSGGQQQRTAIARALVCGPSIVLADEPTGALDSKTGHEILELFLSLNQDHHSTLVLITHDEAVASRFKRCIKIEDGKIKESV